MADKELTGVKKVFNTIVTIVIFVMLLFSLVFVWGDVHVAEVSGLIVNSYSIGLNYYIYDGWKNVAEIASHYNNSLVSFGLYGSLFISIAAFIATVVVVYMYGIRGMISGLKSLVNKQRGDIAKNALIVSLALFAYYNVAKLFSFHAYGPGIFNGETGLTIVTGWGSEFYGFFSFSGMFATLVYLVIEKFSSKEIAKSVKNILIACSFLFILSVISNSATEAFGFSFSYYNSEALGIFNTIILLCGVPLNQETMIFVTLCTALVTAALVFAILLLVNLVKHFFFDKDFKKTKVLAYTIAMTSCALLAMIVGNPALDNLTKDISSTLATVSSTINNFPSIFSCSLVILVLMITAVCLGEANSKETKNEVSEEQNPAELN